MDELPIALRFAADETVAARSFRRAAAAGHAIRLHRGVYASAASWKTLEPESRRRVRAVAVGLGSRTRPVISHSSAAGLHGVPTLGTADVPVHVLATKAAGTRTEGAIRRHATGHPELEIEVVDGLTRTTLARSIVEHCAISRFAAAVVALDWAIREHPVECAPSRLVDLARRLEIVRGRANFERALRFADPRSESAGESLSRAGIHELGFPTPDLQKKFYDKRGFIGRTDFWWPEFNLFGEFDGVGKYIREEFAKGRTVAEVVIDEKRREDRIRATGPSGARWGWGDAMRPSVLRGILLQAGLPTRTRSVVRYV